MSRPILRREDRTHPLIWALAILCTILAVAVILTGLLVFLTYIIYQPKMPYLVVTYAHLDRLDYDQTGLLGTVISLTIMAENDNTRAHATFSDLSIKVRFHGVEIADLRAGEFEAEKNSSVALNYVVPSAMVPLDRGGMEEMDVSLKRDVIRFVLDGQARTRWRVGFVMTVKLWTHLSCGIQFFVSNRTTNGLDCTSKAH